MKLNFPNNLKSKINYDFDLINSNWFRTGGKADIYCQVLDVEELKKILKSINNNIPIFVLGAGTNVLIRDAGFRGAIIKLGKGFNNIELKDNTLKVGAAILDTNLSKFAYNNSIKNFEFYSGIPGTVGGAIKMNAGCYGFETKDIVNGVTIINRSGEETYLDISNIDFDYRSSSIDNKTIVKEVIYKVEPGEKKQIDIIIKKILKMREDSQPLRTKTSGSTFKNPKGHFASKLIEESGCKGMRFGGATVSKKHANFLINEQNSSAKDIEELGKKIQAIVYKNFNLVLEWEIKIIGEKT